MTMNAAFDLIRNSTKVLKFCDMKRRRTISISKEEKGVKMKPFGLMTSRFG